MQIRIPEQRADQVKRLARLVAREPFQKRSWAELGFFLASSALACTAAFILAALGIAGLALAVVLVGVLVLAGDLRAARGFGRWQRALARRMLGEEISEPEPLSPRPGLFAWLRASLGDRAAWRAVGYFVAKLPLTVFGVWFALSVWLEALLGHRFSVGRWRRAGEVRPLWPAVRPRQRRLVAGVRYPRRFVRYRGRLPLCRPVDDEAGRLPGQGDDAPPARARRLGVPGQKPRGVEIQDPPSRHRDPPPYRARPPRRHPSPAGCPGDAARPGQGKARPPRRRGRHR